MFIIGGLSGVVACVRRRPTSQQTDTYYVVAHIHTSVRGTVLACSPTHYWWPKMTGRLLSDRWPLALLAAVHRMNLAFFPMH